jgi:hypothetical protein
MYVDQYIFPLDYILIENPAVQNLKTFIIPLEKALSF